MNVFVTGTAGFIGYHVSQALLARGDTVTGFDNLNDYYDVSLKQARLERLRAFPGVHRWRGILRVGGRGGGEEEGERGETAQPMA